MSDSGLLADLSSEIRAAWAIAKKDMTIYYVKPNIIVSGMLFPLFMFLAFSVGSTATPAILIAGLIAITILFSASSIEPVSIPIERRTKTFDRLLSAPVSLNAVVFGESLSGFLYSSGIVLVPLVIGILFFHTSIVDIPLLILGIVMTSFCIASMGTLFAAYPTESPGDIMSMLNLVRLPLVFMSGVFIPLSSIPSDLRFITYISPLTYGYDLIQASYTGSTNLNPMIDVFALLGFIVLFQLLAFRLYGRYNR